MADLDEGVSSGLAYSVLEDDKEAHQPSYRHSAFINSGPAANRTTLKGCIRASVPHLVIVIIYLAYIFGGGVIFLAIQTGNEATVRKMLVDQARKFEELKTQLGAELIGVGDNVSEVWREFSTIAENRFVEDLYDLGGPDLTYMRSVLYCFATITTIGYGDYVPITTLGKSATVFYALAGIPLTLMFLVDVGNLLARLMVDTLVSKCRRRHQSRSRQSGIYKGTSEPVNGNEQDGVGDARGHHWQDTAWGQRDVSVFVVVAIWLVFFFIASVFIAAVETWSYEEGLFFTATTMTTIGFGDIVPLQYHTDVPYFFACLVHILSTLSVMSMCVILMLLKVLKLISKIDSKISL